MSARREPPPIADDNPPTPPRRPVPEPSPVDMSTVEAAPAYRPNPHLAPLADDSGAFTEQVIAGLVEMRRKPVDPMTDFVADGTRLPRFIKEALRHEAAVRDESAQDILRDALLGVRPLSAELLDAHYFDLYREPRPGA